MIWFIVVIGLLSVYCIYFLYQIILFRVQNHQLLPLFEGLEDRSEIFLKQLKSSKMISEGSIRKLIRASKGHNKLTPDLLKGFDEKHRDLLIIYYVLSIGYIKID